MVTFCKAQLTIGGSVLLIRATPRISVMSTVRATRITTMLPTLMGLRLLDISFSKDGRYRSQCVFETGESDHG